MAKFRKIPVEIEAEQYLGITHPAKGKCNSVSCFVAGNDQQHVHTIHGGQLVNLEIGDWIIPEPDGIHFYPCKDSIFQATYEEVEE